MRFVNTKRTYYLQDNTCIIREVIINFSCGRRRFATPGSGVEIYGRTVGACKCKGLRLCAKSNYVVSFLKKPSAYFNDNNISPNCRRVFYKRTLRRKKHPSLYIVRMAKSGSYGDWSAAWKKIYKSMSHKC